MNKKIYSTIIGCLLLLTIFCSQTISYNIVNINEQSNEDDILTIKHNDAQKTYTLADLENMNSITGYGGRLNSIGKITGPFEYKGVSISTLANEFPSLSKVYTMTSISDDQYTYSYSQDEVQGNVQVYDTEGNKQGIGGVTMILAYEEEEIKDFPGGPLRIAYIDDTEQLTDSFLWSKHVIEIEFFDVPTLNPPTINGPSSGKSGVSYDYSFVSTDPDNLDVSYYIEWGDDTNTAWLGPYPSGEECIIDHTWNEKGSFTIKAKAKNTEGFETDWSTFELKIPKNKILNYQIFHKLSEYVDLLNIFLKYGTF
jgi:hypothetical protein